MRLLPRKCSDTGHFSVFIKMVKKIQKSQFSVLTRDFTGAILNFVVGRRNTSAALLEKLLTRRARMWYYKKAVPVRQQQDLAKMCAAYFRLGL